MEALLSSGGPETDVLVGQLKYGLDSQGSYLVGRRQSTSFSNVNFASPSGVKTVTINVGSSSEWLDPSTCLLSMMINNADANLSLFPATVGAHCLFERLDIRMGSTLVESISEYGKLCEIMTKLSMGPGKLLNEGQYGFGTDLPNATQNLFPAGQHEARRVEQCFLLT